MNRKLPKGTRHIECLVPFGELPEGYMINYVNYPRKPKYVQKNDNHKQRNNYYCESLIKFT